MSRWFRLISNALMKLILPSPLHGLFSKTTLLITVTGRKSGTAYVVPVDYLQSGSSIAIFSSKKHRWWRNIGEGADVRLVVRGKQLDGYATVETPEPDEVAQTMRKLYPRMTVRQAAEIAPNTLMIRVSLNG